MDVAGIGRMTSPTLRMISALRGAGKPLAETGGEYSLTGVPGGVVDLTAVRSTNESDSFVSSLVLDHSPLALPPSPRTSGA